MSANSARSRTRVGSRWLRFTTRTAFRRSMGSAPVILQLVIAVVAAYSIAHFGLGHAAPITAVTVTLSSLGFVRDARPIRVLETALGVTLGIALSELILLAFGQGIWQLSLSLVVTLFAARFISPSPGFAIVAGVQSVLVAMLPMVPGGPFSRTIDGLVGGAIALIVTALVPRDASKVAFTDAKRTIRTVARILDHLVIELRLGPDSDVGRVLQEARSTQPLVDQWRTSLESSIGIATISPWLRRRLPELHRQRVLLAGIDLAVRDLRVVARRLSVLTRDGRPRPELADLLSGVVTGVNLLGQSLDDPMVRPLVRQNLILVAVQLDPDEFFDDSSLLADSVVMEMRPLVMDLLTATGLTEDQARAALPAL